MVELVDSVEAALAELRPSFEADSFELSVEELSADGNVVLAITAGSGACRDCLMPEPMLTQVVETVVRRHAAQVKQVNIIKRGFDT